MMPFLPAMMVTVLLSDSFNHVGTPAPQTMEWVTDAPSGQNHKNLIQWHARRHLKIKDYLGHPPVNAGDAVASTSTTLGFTYQLVDGELRYQIFCEFQKDQSWITDTRPYILAHEQGHFDVTEIYARKLNHVLKDYIAHSFNPNTYTRDISILFNRIASEKEALQQQYDGETDHSRNYPAQMRWLTEIQNELKQWETDADYL